jgi:hypothetical protein
MHFGNYNTLRNSNKKHNAIIEIEIRDDDSFCIKQVRKYNNNDTQQQQANENNFKTDKEHPKAIKHMLGS